MGGILAGVATTSRIPRARTTAPSPAPQVKPAKPPATAGPRPSASPGGDPDGGSGGIHELLKAAVAEAARLLDADGAMVYLIDPATGHLRFAHDAGIRNPRTRKWIRSINLPVGVGLVGQAVAERAVVRTDDYLADPAFTHAPETDRVVIDINIRSMVAAPLAAGDEVFGALGTFSARPDAFSPAQIGLVRALADHAAAAMANARLIEALDESRAALARRAQAEQALREIAARITALRDRSDILRDVVKHAGRLVGADGVILDLLDPDTGNLRWALDDGLSERFNADERAQLWISVGVGATGTAVAEGRVVIADDDLAAQFPPSPESTAFYERTGFRSMIAAPISGDSGPLGVIEVYSKRPGAFTAEDGGLIGALASQAAIAITNAHLIDELAGSRARLAQRADAERTLREIAARVTAILDPAEVLQQIVEETTRLLESDGARIDLYDPAIDALRWSYAAGATMAVVPDWATSVGLKSGQAVSGAAYATQRPVRTDDYLVDDRFAGDDNARSFIVDTGIRSVIAVPLAGDTGALGTLSVVSRRASAYDDADQDVLMAFAIQASIAIRNARLMEELARSRDVIARRAEAEQALREIAVRITAIREPADLLQHVVDEARRLLRAEGAVIVQFNPETQRLEWAFDAGLPKAQRNQVRASSLRIGEGLSGMAVALGRVMTAGDYLSGDFRHDERADAGALRVGIGDLIVAPIIGESGPLGAIEVFKHESHSFDEIDEAVLGGLADQAAIAFTNARLIEELEQSQAAVARRADTERALREITARIAALREPEVILDRVVQEARRLLGTDGAHLTRMSEDGTYLVPVVVVGGTDADSRAWLLNMQFPLGGGINGLAASRGEAVWTSDYAADPRIPHEVGDAVAAARLRLCGMAAAPLRAPGGEVIGTLAISTAEPRSFDPEELDLLQGLADQAAIAITNSTLLTKLSESEERYRFLVESAPDMIWSIDSDAQLTFVSDAVERLTGLHPADVLGRHFGVLIHESSRDVAEFDYTADLTTESPELRGRVNLVGPDGEPVPAEFVATARLDEAGRFAGANGSVRDMREQDRLERNLRDSEGRYRFLVDNSPDVVFSTDADGLFTFMSDAMERMSGWRPQDLIGRHFGTVVDAASIPQTMRRWAALVEDPSVEQVAAINLQGPDGRLVPAEVSAIGMVDDEGAFAGIHGATRDVSVRARLERELRESEERYRYLVASSPDLVWVTDEDGTFTFISDAARTMLGREPAELIGRSYDEIFAPEAVRDAGIRFRWVARHPTSVHRMRLPFRHADGHDVLVEISGTGMTDETGRFMGAHGAARDVSERDRLERHLRRQAGELASSEERAHLARELHDSVTQALFSMSLVTRSVELLLDRDSDRARTQLGQLRDLQREALAEMRALIFELRPGNIEQDGLIRALRTHSSALQGRIGLPIVVETTVEGRLPLEVEEVLYRIAQEALHNVVKHAGAREARLELDRVRDGVRLRIVDDGRGFDPEGVPDGHLGLAGMRARADKIGARFRCVTVAGEGTTIEVIVPDAALEAAAATPVDVEPGTIRVG
jgi:PAS domain S-box-containing protein